MNYDSDWYETVYHQRSEWLKTITTSEDLIHLYDYTYEFYKRRILGWINPFRLHGSKHLELGFNSGKTVYYFAQKYPNIIVDGVDFSEALQDFIPLICGTLPNIGELKIESVDALSAKDATYNSVSCFDLIEHITEECYQGMIREIRRVLVPEGLVFMHVGTAVQEEHIHIISQTKLVYDMILKGFSILYLIPEFAVFVKGKEVLMNLTTEVKGD